MATFGYCCAAVTGAVVAVAAAAASVAAAVAVDGSMDNGWKYVRSGQKIHMHTQRMKLTLIRDSLTKPPEVYCFKGVVVDATVVSILLFNLSTWQKHPRRLASQDDYSILQK